MKNVQSPINIRDENVKWYIENIHNMVEYASVYGIMLALENMESEEMNSVDLLFSIQFLHRLYAFFKFSCHSEFPVNQYSIGICISLWNYARSGKYGVGGNEFCGKVYEAGA